MKRETASSQQEAAGSGGLGVERKPVARCGVEALREATTGQRLASVPRSRTQIWAVAEPVPAGRTVRCRPGAPNARPLEPAQGPAAGKLTLVAAAEPAGAATQAEPAAVEAEPAAVEAEPAAVEAAAAAVERACAAQVAVSSAPAPAPAVELAFYRKYTEAMLRRYARLKMQGGRVPSLLGRELFRGKVTHYEMHGFDDIIIFCCDVERCLSRLKPDEQRILRRIGIQEYTQGEAAGVLGLSLRGCIVHYGQALDRLTRLFLEVRLLVPLQAVKGSGAQGSSQAVESRQVVS